MRTIVWFRGKDLRFSDYAPRRDAAAAGAMGPDRYVETVNPNVCVYNRSGGLISQAGQASWTGFSAVNGDAVLLQVVLPKREFDEAGVIAEIERIQEQNYAARVPAQERKADLA
jgi:hypothetical protein